MGFHLGWEGRLGTPALLLYYIINTEVTKMREVPFSQTFRIQEEVIAYMMILVLMESYLKNGQDAFLITFTEVRWLLSGWREKYLDKVAGSGEHGTVLQWTGCYFLVSWATLGRWSGFDLFPVRVLASGSHLPDLLLTYSKIFHSPLIHPFHLQPYLLTPGSH